MKKLIPFTGIILIIMGTLVLVGTHFCNLDNHNWLLLSGLLFIVAGCLLHIRLIKRQGKY